MDISMFAKPVFKINVPAAGEISCRTCTVGTYRRFEYGTFNKADLGSVILGEMPPFLISTKIIFVKNYVEAIEKYCDENCDILRVPEDGNPPEKKCKLNVNTFYDHCVFQYSGIDFERINFMDIIDYKMLLSDSVKLMILQNKIEPVDYLNGCWCYMHDKATIDDMITETVIE